MIVVRSLYFPRLAVLLLASPGLFTIDARARLRFLESAWRELGFPFSGTEPSTSAGLREVGRCRLRRQSFLFLEETCWLANCSARRRMNWYNQTGVFYNNPSFQTITNLSSSQAGYLFDTPGLSLSPRHLASTYHVGQPYQLTVALGAGGEFGAMPLGDPIQLGLYYMSGGSRRPLHQGAQPWY